MSIFKLYDSGQIPLLQGMICVNLVEYHTNRLYHDRAFSSTCIYVYVAAGDSFLCLTFLVVKSRVSHDWAEMAKLAISYLDPRSTNLNNKCSRVG